MSLQAKTILLIDDDEMIHTLVTRILKTAGYETISAMNVKEALTLLQNKLPDAIILDLEMPGHNGLAFLTMRRMNPVLSTIPVVVLSGIKNEGLVEKALELGAEQFLEKPIEARLILQKLRYVIFSGKEFVYALPSSGLAAVDADIDGNIVSQSDTRIKIESLVKFHPGKPVQVFSKAPGTPDAGTPLVFRADDHPPVVLDGLFNCTLSITGLNAESKKEFEVWRKGLFK